MRQYHSVGAIFTFFSNLLNLWPQNESIYGSIWPIYGPFCNFYGLKMTNLWPTNLKSMAHFENFMAQNCKIYGPKWINPTLADLWSQRVSPSCSQSVIFMGQKCKIYGPKLINLWPKTNQSMAQFGRSMARKELSQKIVELCEYCGHSFGDDASAPQTNELLERSIGNKILKGRERSNTRIDLRTNN